MSLALRFRRSHGSLWRTGRKRFLENKLSRSHVVCEGNQRSFHMLASSGCQEYSSFRRRKMFHIHAMTLSTGNTKLDDIKISKTENEDNIDMLSSSMTEMENLKKETELILSTYDKNANVTQDMIIGLLDLLSKWYKFSSSIILPKHKKQNRFSYFNIEEDMSLPEHRNELKILKSKSAEIMDEILGYHIKHNIPSSHFSSIKNPTLPFSLVMDSWNQSSSSDAGSKTAAILESWGEIYGGDMSLAPTINEFNIVLDAYAKAASGYYNINNGLLPGESAWDTYSFLSQLNDMSLLPNIESCIHTIHALTHHALAMRYSSRHFPSTTMKADVAAIRAYSVWKKILENFEKEDSINSSLIWQANNDIITLSSHGMLRRDDVIQDSKYKDNLGLNVGKNTDMLLKQVIERFGLCSNNNGDKYHLQQAFLSAMLAWKKEQEETIAVATKDSDCSDLVFVVTRAALSTVALLTTMKENDLSPSPAHYYSVIKAYGNCLDTQVLISDGNGIVQKELSPHIICFELLKEMEDSKWDITRNIPAGIYKEVINVLMNNIEDLKLVDINNVYTLLNKMIDLYKGNFLWMGKNRHELTVTVNNVFKMYSQVNMDENLCYRQASSLMHRFLKMREKSSNRSLDQRPNALTYSTYLHILERMNRKDMVSEALFVLNEMEKDGLEFNMPSYALAIKIIGNNANETNVSLIHTLVQNIVDKYQSLPSDERKGCDFNGSMLYSLLISAKMKSKRNNPWEAIELLNSVKDLFKKSNDPNLKPDAVLYGTVLNSISRKSSKNLIQTSIDLLDEMESMYQEGHTEVMPTKQCYTAVINTLSKSGNIDTANQVERILERMESLYQQTGDDCIKPDHITYSSVLRAFARSKTPVNYNRAEELIDIMEEKARNGDILWPNASVYTSLINIFTRSNMVDVGEKASTVIDRMDREYASGNHFVKADSFVFCAAINAWNSSKSPGKVIQAWRLFDEMCRRYDDGDIRCKPDVTAFNFLLKVCACNENASSHDDSVRIALLASEKLLESAAIYGPPNDEMFNNLMKVFGLCISDPSSRKRFITTAFERCAKEGYVSDSVLKSLKRFDYQLYKQLKSNAEGRVSSINIPNDWSRNI